MEIREFIITYKYDDIKCYSFWGDRMKEAVEEFNRLAERKGGYEKVTSIQLHVRIES